MTIKNVWEFDLKKSALQLIVDLRYIKMFFSYAMFICVNNLFRKYVYMYIINQPLICRIYRK